MSRRVVIVGGFITSEQTLEPVAHAAIELGLASDADIITFAEGMEYPGKVERAATDQLLLTHSAGIVAVGNAEGVRPEQLVAYNGPEPRSIPALRWAAVRNLGQNAVGAVAGPHQSEHRRVITNGLAELVEDPWYSLQHVGTISRFSTFGQLAICQEAGIQVSAALTKGDVFFPYDPSEVPKGLDVHLYDGKHDELLVNPKPLLNEIAVQLQMN